MPSLSPQLLADLNRDTQGSNPTNFVTIGGTAYFTADDGVHGNELWKSDGTAAGTIMLTDINPTGGGWFPYNLTNVNGTLFFAADDGTHGGQLWDSDGTAAGTMMVTDINPTGGGLNPGFITNVNGTLFFAGDDGTEGSQLWKYDPIATSTIRLTDINSAGGGLNPTNLTNVNGTLFFAADDGTDGMQLWASDGTAAGMVTDINPTGGGLNPTNLTDVNGTLFFAADDGTNGRQLWASDGTAAGMVTDINPTGGGLNPSNLTDVNGGLFFAADDGVNGRELWASSGTAAGTAMVKDINPTGSSYPTKLTNVNGTLFFTADDGTDGRQLWASSGTAAGTASIPNTAGTNPDNLTAVGGELFFTANDGIHGIELWETAGTAGAAMVKDINPGPDGSGRLDRDRRTQIVLVNANGLLFFAADDGTHGTELWESGGTAGSTLPLKDINAITFDSYPSQFTGVNEVTYFEADDGVHGPALWETNGTAAGTALVTDSSDHILSNPSDLTNVNGTLFFAADDGTHGSQLWESDGTAAGTMMVTDINPTGGFYPTGLTYENGTLYFLAVDGTGGVYGSQLWAYNPDSSSTPPVKLTNINPGGSSLIRNLTNVNGTLFFTADDGTHGIQLWDWSPAGGGTMLTSGGHTIDGFVPMDLTAVNELGLLFFTDYYNSGLWRSDGTPGGTYHVGPNPFNLTSADGKLFFSLYGENQLWTSDGTIGGTTMVAAFGGFIPGSPGVVTNVNGTLFFDANDGTHGDQLWESDAIAGGAMMVTEASGGLNPLFITNVNGTLFFAGDDGTDGSQLWEYDPIAASATRLTDINPAGGGLYPAYIMNVNGTLFFQANDGLTGYEPWVLNPNQVPTTTVVSSNANPSVDGQEIALTATVTGSGGGTPSGSVQFYTVGSGGNTPLSSPVSLIGGTATLNNVSLSAGTYTITAEYTPTPNSNFLPSSSAPLSQQVNSLFSANTNNLQAVINNLPQPSSGSTNTITVDVATSAQVNDVIAAVNQLASPTTPVTVEVDLAPNTSTTDITLSPPAGVTLIIHGNGTTIVVGNSPAFTVLSGSIIITGVTFTTGTDAPTILVAGGSVTLRNDVIQESTGYSDAAIAITGGTVDLGTSADPGGNVLNINGLGALVHNTGPNPVKAVGDTFEVDGTVLTSAARIAYLLSPVTVTALTALVSPSLLGQAVTFTATVSPGSPALAAGTPSGTVQFRVDGSNVGTLVPLTGSSASISTAGLAVGPHTITAVYSGDGNFLSSSGSTSLTVIPPASLSGTVFKDFNNDGRIDFGERGIAGVTIALNGTDDLGHSVSLPPQKTDSYGAYLFRNLRPSSYTITETQPAGYPQGIDSVGTAGGSLAATDHFVVHLGQGGNGLDYNFGEQPPAGGSVQKGQTAGIGFWNNKNGQTLIKALNGGTGHQLGDWLAATLPNVFGASAGANNANNLAGQSNAYVAALFQSDFMLKGAKLDAQVLATALSVYVTNATLDPTKVAAQYGFTVSGDGVGTATVNIGSNGDAFGVANNTTLSVMDLLLATDAQAVNGLLYNVNATKRNEANTIYSAVNQAGGIR